MTRARTRWVLLLLLGSLLVGLGQAALLPPFEGFDETAHYSYVQQLADTGRWPRRGDHLSQDISRYLETAPTAENMHGRWTYPDFFPAGAETIEIGRETIWSPPGKARNYEAGGGDNWEAQHPPLYYALLSPAYLLSKSWSLGAQLFLLRGLSYLLAWIGLCSAALLLSRQSKERAPTNLPLAIALWPAIFPMWFPEMARLGNDSLVTIFAAFTLILMFRIERDPEGLRDYGLLGMTLGFAALSKATFLPVIAAAFVLLAARAWMSIKTKLFAARLRGLLICATVTAAFGGWWYVLQVLSTGNLIGSNDAINLQSSGGIIASFAKQNVTLLTALRGALGLPLGFLWAGTWSFVLPPLSTMVPLAALVILTGYGCCRHLLSRGLGAVDVFALLTFAFFTAALIYHSVIFMSLTGNTAPAWYLHSLAPILALSVAYGLSNAMGTSWLRRPAIALSIYPLAFLPAVMMLAELFFAGCAPLLDGRRYFALSRGLACLEDYRGTYENLAVLALPGTGLVLFAIGWVLLIAGTIGALGVLSTPVDQDQRPVVG
jgi:hypothetical protein